VVEVGWHLVERNGQLQPEWETASYAAGHHRNSAGAGEAGNVVISGHHNIKGEVFRRLIDVKVGDQVVLYTADGRSYTYVVTEAPPPLLEVGISEAERREHARYMDPTSDPTLTLITCWPYWTNTHRVIRVAKLKE